MDLFDNDTDTIPIISLHRPWADWVREEWKTIETRLHDRFRSLKGRRIGIHASLTWDRSAFDAARQFLSPEQLKQLPGLSSIGGAVTCTAFVMDFRRCGPDDGKRALIECYTPRFGLVLRDVRIVEPVVMRGHQGLWYARVPPHKG